MEQTSAPAVLHRWASRLAHPLRTARRAVARGRELFAGSAPGANVGSPPANYGVLDGRKDLIPQDARYAIQIAESYVNSFPGGRAFLQGKSVLELGPGFSFATALILKCWGASRVTVSDRFLVRFQRAYHAGLYREVAARLREADPAADVAPLEKCAAAGRHVSSEVNALECPLEELSNIHSSRFDITLSNAVLEHVFDPVTALKSLCEATNPGGVGFHQVDFRDHRDFSRPLEYLLLDEFSFFRMFEACHGECGNRVRAHQFKAMVALAGFREAKFTPNMWAEQPYLDEFVPRLRKATVSPYSEMDVERFREISGQFAVVK